MQYYGVDLGTSSCIVARLGVGFNGDFTVKCLSDEDGEYTLPSIVGFESDSKFIFGSNAVKLKYLHPDQVVELVKVRLGKTKSIEVNIQGNRFFRSPQEISAYLLNRLNQIHDGKIKDIVITVPAFFDQGQKDATMQAGLIAEVSPKLLIEEPTAALINHIFEESRESGNDFFKNKQERRILVFDFGGGTLDLSLVNLKKTDSGVHPQVLSVGGDPKLGGNTIDLVFCKHIIDFLAFSNKNDEFINSVHTAFQYYYANFYNNEVSRFPDDTPQNVKEYIFRLKNDIEEAKIKLSGTSEVIITFSGNIAPINISREIFEAKVICDEDLDIKGRIENSLIRTIPNDVVIDEVLLVGGSSNIPIVRKIILDTLGKFGVKERSITVSKDFETAVAKGAAIQAALINGVEVPPFFKNKCESVVARDIEISNAGIESIIVPRGTPYPFRKRKEFLMEIGHALSESIELVFNELSEKTKVNQKAEICRYKFYLPFFYTGDKIRVMINIDEAGLYQIEAIHEITKESVEFEPQKLYSLNDDELSQAVENMVGSKRGGI